MESIKDWIIAFIARENNPLGFALLAGSSLIEYVFPPFPGDTIVLLGAVLVIAHHWSFAAVYASVVAGSVAGGMLVYWLGTRLEARRRRNPTDDGKRRAALDTVIQRFKRHGPAYLALNRFLPGFRAVFFLAAGMAGLRARDVALWGGVSAAAWGLLLIGLGSALGANLSDLELWLGRYMTAIWGLVGAAAVFYLIRRLLARRRQP